MKIGLLQCGHIEEQFEHFRPDEPVIFQNYLADYVPDMTLITYDACHGQLPQSVDECDAYLINGSASGVYDDLPWIEPLAAFLRQVHAAQRKMVGICFGHQMIAHALGGCVRKSERGWGVGVKSAQIQLRKDWMQPEAPSYKLLLSHQDQVIDLPPDSEVLAGNEHCPVSMFTVGENALGIQAHPEFDTQYAKALLDMRFGRIDEQTVEAAMNTLETPTDEVVVGQWIGAFLSK